MLSNEKGWLLNIFFFFILKFGPRGPNEISIGSGNGLVPSDNKPLTWIHDDPVVDANATVGEMSLRAGSGRVNFRQELTEV